MNQELLRLIEEAGARGRPTWEDVLMIQNYAPFPPPPVYAGTDSWDRGFNLVVLEDGRPTHFCKVRPARDASLIRETEARNCLAQEPTRGLRIPPARCASSDSMMVQVSDFLAGSHYGRIVPSQSATEHVETVGRLLEGQGALIGHAMKACPSIARQSGPLALYDETKQHLDYLTPLIEIGPGDVEAVTRLLEAAGEVGARPQHCDLWWRNIIVNEDEFWAIDLEDFGNICVPLYDDLTLLGSTFALRGDGSDGGLQRLTGESDEAAASRAILSRRAGEEGVREDQLDAVLAYFVMQRACIVHRRAGPGYAEPHMRTARDILSRLIAGERNLLG